jgi:hypothetical protein
MPKLSAGKGKKKRTEGKRKKTKRRRRTVPAVAQTRTDISFFNQPDAQLFNQPGVATTSSHQPNENYTEQYTTNQVGDDINQESILELQDPTGQYTQQIGKFLTAGAKGNNSVSGAEIKKVINAVINMLPAEMKSSITDLAGGKVNSEMHNDYETFTLNEPMEKVIRGGGKDAKYMLASDALVFSDDGTDSEENKKRRMNYVNAARNIITAENNPYVQLALMNQFQRDAPFYIGNPMERIKNRTKFIKYGYADLLRFISYPWHSSGLKSPDNPFYTPNAAIMPDTRANKALRILLRNGPLTTIQRLLESSAKINDLDLYDIDSDIYRSTVGGISDIMNTLYAGDDILSSLRVPDGGYELPFHVNQLLSNIFRTLRVEGYDKETMRVLSK